ncbi:hypothetical protein [Umezawaea beigongshangensis]|uniref:hypothetical protein n=1 Tax=Umezawaea beigongshangensis TaxID=2780383 RepID=UPI0018F10BDB|nr:hypothetical protein [Umezawaea beigongshangensis]
MGVRAGALVVCALVAAGCTGDGDGHVVRADRDGVGAAVLELAAGADSVRVEAADLGEDLYRVRTPDGSGVEPFLHDEQDDDVVRLGLRPVRDRSGAADVTISVSSAVTWTIRLTGGAKSKTVDVTATRLTGLEIGGGSDRVEAALPRPAGTLPVRLTGGASTVALHLTGDAPVEVELTGGAGGATVDGVARSGIAGGTVLSQPEWAGASDRYAVEGVAGLGSLVVDRRP